MERVDKEKKAKIMDMIKKAGDAKNYKISWDVKGLPYKIQKRTNVKKGGKSRASGAAFELKVRKDLERQGRIVDKWSNNVDLEKDQIIISRKYNPFKKMLIGLEIWRGNRGHFLCSRPNLCFGLFQSLPGFLCDRVYQVRNTLLTLALLADRQKILV